MTTKIDTLIEAYAIARAARETLAAQVKAAQETEDREEAALFDAMEAQGLRSVRHKDLGLFSLNDLAWAKVTDEALARSWAEATAPEIITLKVEPRIDTIRSDPRFPAILQRAGLAR